LQAYLLSHIKAPLREEKREVASYPNQNLAKLQEHGKQFVSFFAMRLSD